MELRSHRSRSRTPAFGGSGSSLSDHESHQNEVNHITSHRVLRSTKTRTIQSEEHISMQSSYSSQHSAAELQQMEINSSHTENQVNHALESGKYSSEEEELLALKMYREAKEYWLRYPKTDYTYSPHSKDRVELAPGVVNMPNMSRKSIHNGADYDERVEYMAHSAHKETNTSFLSDDSTCCRLSQRSGFTTLNNNKDYMIKQNGGRVTSTRLLRMTFIERTWFAVYTLVRLVSAPFSAANRLVLYTVSMLHHLASQLLLVDTWLLRSYADVYHGEQSYVARSKARSSTSSASKVKKVLWLCLIPLLLFGGMWLLSALGHAIGDVAPSILPIFTKTREEVITSARSPPVLSQIQPPNDPDMKSVESLIRVQLDAPVRTGLSSGQLMHIARSLKDNLRLDVEADSIVDILEKDPKVQRLDNIDVDIDQIIKRVLESPALQLGIRGSDETSSHIAEQEKRISQLQSQLDELRVHLNAAIGSQSAQYAHLSRALKRCCRLNALQMEQHLNSLITAILNSPEHKANVSQWLSALFVAQNEIEAKLNNVTEKMNKRVDDLVAQSAQRVMADVSALLAQRASSRSLGSVEMPPNELQIRAIVKDALATYDADKTGLVDYALESAGGQILSTRCTEHYSAKTSVVSIFSIPLWYSSSSPRTVITPGVLPGECWAFQSFPGFLIIKLSHNVTLREFSYEHVSRQLMPSGKLDSAPKDFQVFGLREELDREPVLLGEFRYDALGDSLQFFPVRDDVASRTFQIIELKVNSNHGNPNYTCLYRFRVHGHLAT